MTTQEDEIIGRLAAVEYLTSATIAVLMSQLPSDEAIEDTAQDMAIRMEDQLSRLTPERQRPYTEAADRILSSAVVSAKASRSR